MREVERLLEHAKRLWNGNEYWEMLRERVEPLFDVMHRLTSNELHRSLDASGAYCFAAGEVSLACGQNISAVSMFHRALDFFLQARCAEHHLIRETVSGLVFEVESREDKMGVLSCYTALRRGGVLLRSDKLHARLLACNRIRNRLITAHAVYGSGAGHASRYRDAVLSIMQQIDSAAVRSVEQIAKLNFMNKSLNPAMLFACETDLEHCVARVAVP
jgi:hypothetical protein